MTERVGFLSDLPVHATLDGELVALDTDGRPDFPLICECVLQRRCHVPLTYMVFDVLSVDGHGVASERYATRRPILEELRLDAPQWRTPQTFSDGDALWDAVCLHELEGVVAKPLRSRYVPGERGWIKTKNRGYWRWEIERENPGAVQPPFRRDHRPVGSRRSDGESPASKEQCVSRTRPCSPRSLPCGRSADQRAGSSRGAVSRCGRRPPFFRSCRRAPE